MAQSLEGRVSILVDPLHFEGRVARFVGGLGIHCLSLCREAQQVRGSMIAEPLLLH
jgi:hypothetical protein